MNFNKINTHAILFIFSTTNYFFFDRLELVHIGIQKQHTKSLTFHLVDHLLDYQFVIFASLFFMVYVIN